MPSINAIVGKFTIANVIVFFLMYSLARRAETADLFGFARLTGSKAA